MSVRKLLLATTRLRFVFLSLSVALVSLAAFSLPARPPKGKDKQEQPAAPGKMLFLVSREIVRDPFFNESAVLMLPAFSDEDSGLIVGLVVNKPARVPLSQFFPDDSSF